MKKKILFAMHELTLGGAQRVIVNIVNAMDKELYETHLCVFNNKGQLLNEIDEDVLVHNMDKKRVLFGILSFFRLILKLKPNVVFTGITHINTLTYLGIPIFNLIKRNILFVTREVNNPSIRSKYLKKSKLLDKVYKRTINNFDLVIAQSSYMKKDIVRSYHISEEKVKVVPNPINLDIINQKLQEQITDSFGKKESFNILAVGGLRFQKGFDQLLEIVEKSDQKFYFTIIGEGQERGNLEQIISERNLHHRVTLLGARSNPYKYIKDSDLFILTSRYEGFPNVVLEANACGNFVVAYNCPGVDEEIIKEGINGSLVEVGNSSMFCDKLNKYSKTDHDKNSIISGVIKYDSLNIAKIYVKTFENSEKCKSNR